MSQIITINFREGQHEAIAAEPLEQWAYGQKILFTGIELPEAYQVDFSNYEFCGTSIPRIGGADGVSVPVEVLASGRNVYAFIWSQDETSGRRPYRATIRVIPGPIPNPEEPNPEEESMIGETLAALNAAAEKADDAKQAAEAAADASLSSAEAAAASADGAATSAQNAADSAQDAADSAQDAQDAAAAGGNSARDAAGFAQYAARSATAAAASAQDAAGSATAAAGSATAAAASAQEAGEIVDGFEEQIVPAAVQQVNQAGANQTQAVQSAGAGQIQAVEAAGAEQMADIAAAGATQVGAVEDKGEEVLASIPEDYSALSGEVSGLKSAIGDFIYGMAPWSSSSGSVVKDITGPFASGTAIYARFVSISGGTAGKGNIYGISNGETTTLQGDCVIGEDYVVTLPSGFEKIRLYLNVSNRPETLTGVAVFMDGSKLDIPGELVKIRKLFDYHLTDFQSLYTEVNHIPVNLYKGEFIPNGYYDTDGTWVENSSYKMLKLNNGELHEGDVITFSPGFPFYQNQFRFDVLSAGGAYVKYIAGTYDGDKDGQITLTGVGADGFKLLMRVKTSQDASTFVAVTDGYLTEVSNFKVLSDEFSKQIAVLNPLKNKVINCLGDSFTASPSNTSWCGKLAERVGCVCNNYGVASSRISVDSEDVLSFLNRYDTMDTSADITVIFGGINDANSIYFGDVSLGSMDSALDNTTFYGALRLLIEDIKAYMPGKKIIGVIPPDFEPTVYYGALKDVQNACREVYEFYQIPYADIKKECQEMFEDTYNNATYRQVNNNNNWHPSTLGHIAISEVIEGTLEMYIKA